MPPSTTPYGRIGLIRGLLLASFVCGVSPIAAQDALELQHDYPGSAPLVCPTQGEVPEPSPQDQAQAARLASEADAAVVLGDYERARELLSRASELDPTVAEVAYSHARVLETLGRTEESMLEYCRTIALGADPVSLRDAEVRLEALDEELQARISPVARERFADGLAAASEGLYPLAVTAFTDALEEYPEWPEALYNRAIVLERMGEIRESIADYRRYLELIPDADSQMARVAQHIGMLEGLESVPTPSPGNTLALGMLFPGMGQYYSGRGVSGSVFLGTAATALAIGVGYEKVTVRCLTDVPGGADCPQDEIVDETSRRPLLGPALGVAGVVTLVAAVEAWIRAKQARKERETEADRGGLGLSGPSILSNGVGVDLSIFSFTFR
ncbi:MAG: tetratricopeptide repeat protein [Halobacteriales archaeon]|nr:tetratricopeptide repeat protein [Halobacteriales archaeon]